MRKRKESHNEVYEDRYDPTRRFLVPRYTDPQVVINELYEVIDKQEQEIERLRKENLDLTLGSIRQSEEATANILSILLNKEKFFPKDQS
jgi:hypothetical protein